MEDINLVVICIAAFAAVLILLSLLAGLLRLLTFLFPDRSEESAGPAEVSAPMLQGSGAEPEAVEESTDERSRVAAMAGVMLALEEEETRRAAARRGTEQPGSSWKLMGRLEGLAEASSMRGWKRSA